MASNNRKMVKDVGWAVVYTGLAALTICLGAKLAPAAEADRVLLDFYADWCGPCRTMGPQVDALAAEGYAVRRVNVEQDWALADQFRITSLPCFVMLEQGREVERVSGQTSIERLRLMYRREARPATNTGNRGPHPAWRYEKAVGHRRAIVRIYCQEGVRTRSIGSGTLVKWGSRLFVLTAKHVVKDATKIVVEFFSKKTRNAKLVALDATWDCAVLEIGGPVEEVEPVELEMGEAAMQTAGNRLESCGYGPDGKLACNTGLFQGYRRSTEAPNGPDDWMVISGHARQGDSGGGVFNVQGKLVGVLWGTDGESVVCVQAGRVHQLLNAAAEKSQAEEKAAETSLVSVQAECFRRPPKNEPPRQPSPACPVPQTDPELREAVRSIDNRLAALVDQQTAKPAEKPQQEPSPLITGLCILGAMLAGSAVYFATQKN